jgi:O-antigen/teichoic acid export membrane protein
MGVFKSDSSVRRVIKNGVYNALRFVVFTVSGFILIPFLVRQYGSGTYGLIALGGFLTQYVGLIARSIGSCISRFLTIALNKNDTEESCQVFSTAIVANLAMVLMQVPLFALGLWKLHLLIDFPEAQSFDFRILVTCNVLAYFITLIFGIFATPIIAANRIDLTIIIDMAGQVVRLILLFSLISGIGPMLWIIGMVDLAIAVLGSILTLVACRRFSAGLTFNRRHIAWKWVRPIMGMALWTIVAELGQILFQKTDVWVTNRFVNVVLAGVCAALLLWPNFLQQIAKNIAYLILPAFMIDYAHGRHERIQETVLLLSRLFTILALFACGIIMAYGASILRIWMGEEYQQYHIYLILLFIHFPLTLAREAYWGIFPAYNKMHFLGIANLVSGCINIALSLLAAHLGYGLKGVIIATGISLIIQRVLFLSQYVVKMLNIPWFRLFKCYVPGCLVVTLFFVQWIFYDNQYMFQSGMLSLMIAVLFSLEVVFREPETRNSIKAIIATVKRK